MSGLELTCKWALEIESINLYYKQMGFYLRMDAMALAHGTLFYANITQNSLFSRYCDVLDKCKETVKSAHKYVNGCFS